MRAAGRALYIAQVFFFRVYQGETESNGVTQISCRCLEHAKIIIAQHPKGSVPVGMFRCQ